MLLNLFTTSPAAMFAYPEVNRLLHVIDSRWLIAAGVLADWIILLLGLKRFFLALSRRLIQQHPFRHLTSLVDAIAPALTLAIVVSGIAIAVQITPLPEVWRADARSS